MIIIMLGEAYVTYNYATQSRDKGKLSLGYGKGQYFNGRHHEEESV